MKKAKQNLSLEKKNKLGKKGLVEDFLTFFYVALVVILIMGLLMLLYYSKMKNKQDIMEGDLNIQKGMFTTRVLLDSEVRPEYKVSDLVIESYNTKDYNLFLSGIETALQKFYPDGKITENWLIIIDGNCKIIGIDPATEQDTVTTQTSGGSPGVKLVVKDACDEKTTDNLPKITVPNPDGKNILVLFKSSSKQDSIQGRIFGERAQQLNGQIVTSAPAGGLENLQGIPKVTCETALATPTTCGRMCVANPGLVAALKDAAANLPANEQIRINQAYRTKEMQQCLFELNCDKDNNNKCDVKETPTCNPATSTIGCPHVGNPDGTGTGSGAIDINIIRDGVCLNCQGASQENLNYVQNYMCKYKFVRWNKESWHFEYGTNQWQTTMEQRNGGLEPCTY